MIQKFKLENFGPLSHIEGETRSKINLIIGANGSGKTFFLKALYAILRSQEECGRGDENKDFSAILSDKLYWTFQTEKLGDMVRKGVGNRLKASVSMADNSGVAFEFGMDTQKKVKPLHNNLPSRSSNSIFLPPKEVLSLNKVILKSALQDKSFGFDATYVDLVLALQNPTQRGRNYNSFKKSRKLLENMFQGRVEYETSGEKWIYKQGNSRFSINATAEGIKKIAMLDALLGNRFLSPKSVVFIDEPESALHPAAISQFMDIIQVLAREGIQFFIATHSYFVIKKLYLIAVQQGLDVPLFLSNSQGCWTQQNLHDGISDNEIINESIRLFDQELDLN